MNYMIKVLVITVNIGGVFGLNAAAPSKRQRLISNENAPASLSVPFGLGLVSGGFYSGDCSRFENDAPSTRIFGRVLCAQNVNIPAANQNGSAFASHKLKKDADGFYIPAPRAPKSKKPELNASQAEWKRYLEGRQGADPQQSRRKQRQLRKEQKEHSSAVETLIGMKTS